MGLAALYGCGSQEVAAPPRPRPTAAAAAATLPTGRDLPLVDGATQASQPGSDRATASSTTIVATATTATTRAAAAGASATVVPNLVPLTAGASAPAPPSPTVSTTLPPAPTPPTTLPPSTTSPPPPIDPLAARRAAVLAMISYPWQQRLPGWTVEFLPGRTGYLGYTWIAERRIEIYARTYQSAEELAFTLAHELGHAVDLTLFGQAERTSWLEARGRLDVPWWPGGSYSDFGSGCGDWAEAFAVWQLGGTSMSEIAGQPDGADLALVARLARG